MRLSKLQQNILVAAYLNKPASTQKKDLYRFYPEKETNLKTVQDIIHKSLDNLTEKDLIIAYGHKTARKWFIQRIKLTRSGKSLAGKILKGRQTRLKLR